ncbi:MAG: plasmid stabilization protein [Phyllobacteriaceae bacterium]|nr:plasmid stabilization protein [Phyllobacteriaceae bacterium]MBA92838.1 plasmid stabilization protein [Phyllobacteriaceae bacterium]
MSRVLYTPLADRDLESLYLYLHERSEAAADSYLEDLLTTIWRLADLPYSAPQRLPNHRDVRVASVRNHLVLYRAFSDGDGIEVLRIVHGAQDWLSDADIDINS